jgi:site-specific DNA-adenine methylase
MKLLLCIATFLSLNQYLVRDNDKLIGHWKLVKMQTSEVTYDLEQLDVSRSAFFAKLKERTTGATKKDSVFGEIVFSRTIEMLSEMSITFKKGDLFSMRVNKAIEIVDGKYNFDKTSNDLILKDENGTMRYKVLSLSDSSLVLGTTDNTKSTISYKRRQQ